MASPVVLLLLEFDEFDELELFEESEELELLVELELELELELFLPHPSILPTVLPIVEELLLDSGRFDPVIWKPAHRPSYESRRLVMV